MKTRNYISIEYRNNFSSPKLTLMPLSKCFSPHNTFSNRHNHNNKIINIKTSFGSYMNKNRTIFSSTKNSNISNRNTYYKTNYFSPQSTTNVFSPGKNIKHMQKNKKLLENKNSTVSLKKIEFINENEKSNKFINNNILNNEQNLKYIFIGNNKDPPKNVNINQKNINKKNPINKNIEISGQNLIKNNKLESNKSNNSKIDINRNDIKTSIDFISYPSLNSIKKSKNYMKNINKGKLFKSPTYIKVKPLEEYDEIISEYNYDNYINNNRYKILYNTNSNIKPNTKIKTRKNTENNDIDIKIIDDIINNKEKTNKIYKNDINNKRNKINFELKADIGMFDPITLKSNKNLSKDFLIKKEKEKIFLSKLFENQKLKELISKLNYNIDEENKSKEESKNLETEESNKIKSKNRSFEKRKTRSVKSLNRFSKNKLNIFLSDFFNKGNLKPSDLITYIADKICEDIDSFRNKKYNNKNEENIFDWINEMEMNTLNKERPSIHDLLTKSTRTRRKIHIFYSNSKINKIKNEKNLKNSNSNTIINHNIITNDINNNIKINLNKKYYETKSIQTKENIDETDNPKDTDTNNITENKDSIKFLQNEILNKNKGNKGNKKNRSHLKGKKFSKRKKMKKKIKESKNNLDENKLNTDVPNLEDEKENLENEEEKNDEIKDIYEEKNNEFEYIKFDEKSERKKTFIKRSDKLKFSNLFSKNRNKNFMIEKKEDESKEIKSPQKSPKKDRDRDNMKLLDELYDFKEYDIVNDSLILNEVNKIQIEADLKSKLIENMKQILILIKKDPKKREDYIKLIICKKRIKYLIKKLAEKDIKKDLILKNLTDFAFPIDINERKKLYKLMRTLENKIKEELNKYDELLEYDESFSSSEKDDSRNIYEFLPIDDDEKELSRKISIETRGRQRKNLIYDNLYLYADDEDDENNTEIKQEVIDVLNKKEEDNDESKSKEKEEESPRGNMKFFIKRRKFKKIKKQNLLRKITDNYDNKVEQIKKINTLDNKINNFFEKIKILKGENVDELDYDKILNELLFKQGDNYFEENIMKEMRLLNFFKYFQTTRKLDLVGKSYFRNKYSFNSPINFRKSHN